MDVKKGNPTQFSSTLRQRLTKMMSPAKLQLSRIAPCSGLTAWNVAPGGKDPLSATPRRLRGLFSKCFKDEIHVDSTLATPSAPKAGPAMTRERETHPSTNLTPGPWTLQVTSSGDVRRRPLTTRHAPSYPELLSGGSFLCVESPFFLTPSVTPSPHSCPI